MAICVVLLLAALFLAPEAAAQEPPTAPPAAPAAASLTVYLDCPDGGCDFDFFRTDITFVNWVRDRQVADVHILVTGQTTGAGGREYTVTFLGLRAFGSVNDTLRYQQPPTATESERRTALARLFRLGLARYLARTPMAQRLLVTAEGAGRAGAQAAPAHDRWRFWVFRTSVSGWSDGEETYKSVNLHGNFSADRITAQWKTRIAANESYRQSDYEVDDTTTFTNIQRSYSATLLQVKSLGEHWSVGARGAMNSSTYDNVLRSVRLYPAVEYDIFPYSRSTRRQVRFEYNIGVARFDYRDTTIFDRMRDQMPLHRLTLSAAAKEPWGSFDIGVGATQYLHEAGVYRISSFGELSWRLFKGFSLNLFGGYDVIHDQFSLAKRAFTPEEILTRQFRLGTRYSYWGQLQLSYTFGSIYNNVVNPRMQNFFD